jgi:hypothetical protein
VQQIARQTAFPPKVFELEKKTGNVNSLTDRIPCTYSRAEKKPKKTRDAIWVFKKKLRLN